MIELVNVADTYRTIIKKGILTDEIIEQDEQSDFYTDWFIMTAHLPNSCHTAILTDKILYRSKALNKFSKLHKEIGVLFVFDDPVLCFYFDQDGIIFEAISEVIEMTFYEWAEIWMYDLRVHGAIGYLLLLIDRYKRKKQNES